MCSLVGLSGCVWFRQSLDITTMKYLLYHYFTIVLLLYYQGWVVMSYIYSVRCTWVTLESVLVNCTFWSILMVFFHNWLWWNWDIWLTQILTLTNHQSSCLNLANPIERQCVPTNQRQSRAWQACIAPKNMVHWIMCDCLSTEADGQTLGNYLTLIWMMLFF